MTDEMNDNRAVPAQSETGLINEETTIGIEPTDHAQLLRIQEDLLSHASSAAGEVAHRDLFFRYRAGKAHTRPGCRRLPSVAS